MGDVMIRNGAISRGEFCGRPKITYHDKDHCPHWHAHGEGWCTVQFVLFSQGLSIDTTEASMRNGRTVTKRTMETLDDAATRALYEMLKARFEP